MPGSETFPGTSVPVESDYAEMARRARRARPRSVNYRPISKAEPSDSHPVETNLAGGLFFLFHPHHRNFRETLLKRRRLQLTRHLTHDIFRDRAAAPLVTFHANLHGDIEKQSLHIVAIIFRQFDPALAVVRREVRGIDIVHGTARNQPRLQHGSQVRKHQILKALLLRVVEKKLTQQIARKRMNVVALEPRTLARSRQPDRQHYRSLAGARGSRNGLSPCRARGRRLRGGSFDCGRLFCHCGCGRSGRRPATRSSANSATAAAATAARDSWSRFSGRRR